MFLAYVDISVPPGMQQVTLLGNTTLTPNKLTNFLTELLVFEAHTVRTTGQHDEGRGKVAVDGVGTAQDAYFPHLRVEQQHLLQLTRRDLQPRRATAQLYAIHRNPGGRKTRAAHGNTLSMPHRPTIELHELLDAVHEVEVAVCVPAHQVASAVEAVLVKALGGGFGVAHVAQHEVGGLVAQLAFGLFCRHVPPAGGVHELQGEGKRVLSASAPEPLAPSGTVPGTESLILTRRCTQGCRRPREPGLGGGCPGSPVASEKATPASVQP